MRQRRQIEAHERLRPQRRNSPRPVCQQALPDDPGICEARQQERVGPDQDADGHSRHGAARGCASPDQTAQKGRGELRDRGEREQSDRGQLRIAGEAVIDIGQEQNDEDCDATDRKQEAADIVTAGEQPGAPLQNERHDDVVRYHDAERDRFHDHHRGRGRKSAHEGREREEIGMGGERQSEHEHVAVDVAGLEREHAGKRDRDHEQVDQHQIERKQPRRPPDLGLAIVLDHGDVELPRQQHDGEQGEQRHGAERAECGLARQHGSRVGLLEGLAQQRDRAVEQPERDENADAYESDKLHDGFGRDRQHQPVLVLGGVDVPGAEQDGEGRHCHCDVECNVAEHRLHGAARGADMCQDRGQRGRHCFELKRDIGDAAHDGDERDDSGDGL